MDELGVVLLSCGFFVVAELLVLAEGEDLLVEGFDDVFELSVFVAEVDVLVAAQVLVELVEVFEVEIEFFELLLHEGLMAGGFIRILL